ncbi:MAG: sigma-70 family RNA polymerase sigma factor [Actinomycetota bacterium]
MSSALSQFRPPQVVADDTALATALRAGDEHALRTIYERFGALVFSVSVRVTGDRQRAEEVTQQTFLSAWRHADRFEPGRDFAPWLATIARRAAIDVLRAEARRPTASHDEVSDDDPALLHRDPDAEEIERTWAVRAAIDQLDPTDREMIRLQHLDGLTHREIAERLGIAVGTVKSRSFRAHRRLAQRLEHLRPAAGSPAASDESTLGANPDLADDVERGER